MDYDRTQLWSKSELLNLSTATVQMPTVTGVNSLGFPGMSFEHKHLTAEVRHRELPLIPSISSCSKQCGQQCDPQVLPWRSVWACSASRTTAGKTATQKHGTFLNLSATIFLKNRISLTCEILSRPHLCSYWFGRNIWCFEILEVNSISSLSEFHFNEADFFLPDIKWVTSNAVSEHTKLCFDTMEWN